MDGEFIMEYPIKMDGTPRMDGLFHGIPYCLMDDLGGKFSHYFWVDTLISYSWEYLKNYRT